MVEAHSYTESNEEASVIDSRPRSASMFPDMRPKNTRLISNVTTGEYVAVRCRPFSKKESESGQKSIIVSFQENLIVLLDPTSEVIPEEAFRLNRSKEKQFAFDIVIDSAASQLDVFGKTTSFLIEGVLNGYNATVFAYGATGAGKTFTCGLYSMLGTLDSPGVMPNSLNAMFTQIQDLARDREYQVKMCYLEIYNEMIRDLISPSSDVLEIREDPVKGVQVAGLTEILASTPEEVIKVMHLGNRQRTTEPTAANETSSRSHAVLQITVEYKDRASGLEADIAVGKLSMIDLAGSERASNTNNRGLRLIEGANINRSLLALGNCINALCEANEKGLKIHVRYRDSKLTRLLKDSLGGNCRTVMIACISPVPVNFEDTLNTLKYANRAKNIKTNIQRNVFNVSYHISKYTEIIKSLKQEVQELRSQVNSKGKPIIPSQPGIEKYQIELNTHFAEEAKQRKRIQEGEQNVEQVGFNLFDKQMELNQLKKTQGEESAQAQRKSSEIDALLRNLKTYQKTLEGDRGRLGEMEERRDLFGKAWKKAGIKEQQLAVLQSTLAQLIAAMANSDLTLKSHHTESILKHQTQYINTLKSQMMLRDSVITEQSNVLVRHHMEPSPEVKKLLTLEEIEVTSKIAFSKAGKGLGIGPVRAVQQFATASFSSDSLLPPLGQSRIPTVKPSTKSNKESPHNPRSGIASSVPPRRAVNVLQFSPNRKDYRLGETQSGTTSPESLAASHMEKQSPGVRKPRGTIAQKIAASPYVHPGVGKSGVPTLKKDAIPTRRGRLDFRRN